MLQQTRVETVIPYFEKWMKAFPGVADLARASESDVLSAWEGLGYYGRARNLRDAAQKILEEYNGILPDDLMNLIKLPGIGRYTAGAIASIAFNANATTLDGNIRRVFARLFDIKEVVNSPVGEKIIWELLEKELPLGKAGEFNQALMDLGATLCTPRSPNCEKCPLIKVCIARSKGIEEDRPILKTKPVQPQFIYAGAIVQKDQNFLLTKRPSHGLLGGLWEFPNDRIAGEEECLEKHLADFLSTRFGLEIQINIKQAVIRHAYTHFRLILHPYSCNWVADIFELPETCCWVTRSELPNYPMGKVARQISRIINSDGE